MLQAEAKLHEIMDKKSSSEPTAAKIVLEKRKVKKDRRKIKTFIADDKRSGIADRRRRR